MTAISHAVRNNRQAGNGPEWLGISRVTLPATPGVTPTSDRRETAPQALTIKAKRRSAPVQGASMRSHSIRRAAIFVAELQAATAEGRGEE